MTLLARKSPWAEIDRGAPRLCSAGWNGDVHALWEHDQSTTQEIA